MKYWSIIFLFLLTILLRLPSLSEPYWYGDEGVTLTAGRVINQGGILYKDIDDNKPPLLYFLGAAAGGELKPLKTLTLFWSLLTIAIFYLLSKLILSKRLAFLSSLIFAFLANTPILEGNIINGEIYFILPTILAAYLMWKSHVIARSETTKQSPDLYVEIATPFGLAMTYSIGFISSLGFLIKVPALMDFLALVLFLIFVNRQIFSLKTVKQLTVITLGFLTPLLLTTLYFLLNHAFLDFLKGAFINNFAYSLSWQTRWLTPNQYLLLKVSVLMAVSFSLLIRRKKLSSQVIFLTLWFSFSLFGALISSRPYPHYLIQILPSAVLLSIYLLQKKQFSYYLLTSSYLLLILWYQFGTSYQNPYNYYKNYIFYQTGKLSYQQYLMTFDPQTPLTYSLAQFLQIHTLSSEKVFVWSDNSLIYALSRRAPIGRFITAYYIDSLPYGRTETLKDFKLKKPKFVIITLPRREFKELDKIIKNNYIPVEKTAGAQIYKIK